MSLLWMYRVSRHSSAIDDKRQIVITWQWNVQDQSSQFDGTTVKSHIRNADGQTRSARCMDLLFICWRSANSTAAIGLTDDDNVEQRMTDLRCTYKLQTLICSCVIVNKSFGTARSYMNIVLTCNEANKFTGVLDTEVWSISHLSACVCSSTYTETLIYTDVYNAKFAAVSKRSPQATDDAGVYNTVCDEHVEWKQFSTTTANRRQSVM